MDGRFLLKREVHFVDTVYKRLGDLTYQTRFSRTFGVPAKKVLHSPALFLGH